VTLLTIDNLHATVADKPILKGLSLTIGAGEVHAIMGPNGAGKSTLGYVLGGRPGYEVTEGSVQFDGQDLLALEPFERAAAGLFLGFQYPVEIPGVSFVQFLRESLNAQRRSRDLAPLSGGEFLKLAREKAALLGLDMEMSAFPAARKSAPRWSRWAFWGRSWQCSMRPIRASISTRCGWLAMGSTR
jgi:Fe-S cluster assembly ATP-binding protein